jgi:multiple sugar transport system ATP-binding protein
MSAPCGGLVADLNLTDVRKTYEAKRGPVHAVAGVSLRVEDGQFVVLVGPSGCGKSTVLRMIAGLDEPTSGTIAIGGRTVNGVAPKDRDIAMVFQNYALYPHMTVAKNMGFALAIRGMERGEIERRVRDAATQMGIAELLDRRPGELSGGQRQRVALGRAIVREPKVFLFDEPLSNLDAKLRVTMRAELKALHQRLRTTTIYVTHDQEEAMTLGDRVVVMKGGVVRQDGPPLAVFQKPSDRFVAGFVGTPPMNFVEGTVELRGGARVFVGGGVSCAVGGEARSGACVLGVRPAAIALREDVGPQGANRGAIRGTVLTVEPLGEAMDVRVRTEGGATLLARVAAREIAPGARVGVELDPARVHVFEAGDDGLRLDWVSAKEG